MNNEQVTAKWARETAQGLLGDKVKAELDKCLKAITDAVTRNELSTSVGFTIHSLTEKELERRGFTVKEMGSFSSDPREGPYIMISW